jgi:uncharacterized protein
VKISIGEVDATQSSFALPVDVVTSTLVVYGGKGMGKTNFGSVLVEQLTAAGLRWAALDPLGVWWGLRHSADGKGPGIECLILGGSHGDIPIEPTGGAVVADLVVDETVNVIIDFSRKPSGEMWSIGEKVRFVTDYAYRLFQRQGELVDGRRREPIFQILDEAARYIPQLIPAGNPDLAKCVSAWEQLVEEGRNIGIGVGLLTQRSARMNKSVSEVADAIFAFRIVGPNSIGAIMDWLGEHVPKERIRSMIETVRSLDVGHCLIVSPGWLKFEGVVTIRYRTTFDSSATPKPGERARKVKGEGARPDLTKYAERMQATIERARESDPRALKQKISELTRELAKKQTAPGAPHQQETVTSRNAVAVNGRLKRGLEEAMKIIAKIEALGFEDSTISPEQLTEVLERAASQLGKMAELRLAQSQRDLTRIKADVARLQKQLEELLSRPEEDINLHLALKRNEPFTVTSAPPSERRRSMAQTVEGNGHVTAAQSRILAALAEFEAIGRSPVPKKWVAALAGASHTSSSYGNNLGYLRSNGYIDYPGAGAAALTEKGRAKIPAIDPPRSPVEMLARCKEIVSAPQAQILDVLAEKYPAEVDKNALADIAGASATSSSYGNNLGALRSAGMIDYPRPGSAKLASWVMLEG